MISPEKPQASRRAAQNWPSVKAPKALAALFRIGWRIKRQGGT
jgi:hypothetical protein